MSQGVYPSKVQTRELWSWGHCRSLIWSIWESRMVSLSKTWFQIFSSYVPSKAVVFGVWCANHANQGVDFGCTGSRSSTIATPANSINDEILWASVKYIALQKWKPLHVISMQFPLVLLIFWSSMPTCFSRLNLDDWAKLPTQAKSASTLHPKKASRACPTFGLKLPRGL